MIIQQSEGPNSPNIVGNVTVYPEKPKRTISPIKEQLIGFLGTHPEFTVHVEVQQGDKEASDFANQLFETIKDAGWHFDEDRVESFMASTQPITGVLIRTESGQNPAAIALQQALGRVGIKAEGEIVQGLRGKGVVVLQVGTQP
jgi:hypothetical protein